MYSETNKKQPIIEAERITIAEYMRAFLDELAKKEGTRKEIKQRFQAEIVKGLMDNPDNTKFKSMTDFRSGFPFWDEQRVDFVPSNLGQNSGFIFYFICNGCGNRRKDLYFPSMIDEPLCRVCCRLQYKQPKRKARSLSRIVNKPSFSTDDKYILMKRVGINREDMENYLSNDSTS